MMFGVERANATFWQREARSWKAEAARWKDEATQWIATASKPCPACLDREMVALKEAFELERQAELTALIRPIVKAELAAAKSRGR